MDKDCHGVRAQNADVPIPESYFSRLKQAREEAAADADLRGEELKVSYEGREFVGWMSWCEGCGPSPLILIVHNYAGMKTFDKEQAAYLARSGFAALAVDMYGETSDPSIRIKTDSAIFISSMTCSEENVDQHYYQSFTAMNKTLRDLYFIRGLIGAWLEAGRAHPSVEEAGRAAAIGYCYGGMVMFEIVRAGLDVDAVISFHGGYQTKPIYIPGCGLGDPETFDSSMRTPPNTYASSSKVRILVENGDGDHFKEWYPEAIPLWKEEMDAVNIDWVWHDYARTPHGFALAPDICTEYTEAADRRSTLAMWAMLREVWPDVKQKRISLNACGTPIYPYEA